MKVIMLAAGVGSRLGKGGRLPKALLEFGSQTLLERHIKILSAAGLESLVIGVGFEAERIADAVKKLHAENFVRLIGNPDYRKGSITTLWALKDAIPDNEPILLMDADVLYDPRLIGRLLTTPHANCFLLDRDVEEGEEPVKLCVRSEELIDFHRCPTAPCDYYGESVGFFRFSPEIMKKVMANTKRRLKAGEAELWYEEAIRDVLLSEPTGTFSFEDVTGLPWIEIDFPEDICRAEKEILPKLLV